MYGTVDILNRSVFVCKNLYFYATLVFISWDLMSGGRDLMCAKFFHMTFQI